MSARIIVTLTCAYTGDDVDEYDAAMFVAESEVRDASLTVERECVNVKVLDVQVSG